MSQETTSIIIQRCPCQVSPESNQLTSARKHVSSTFFVASLLCTKLGPSGHKGPIGPKLPEKQSESYIVLGCYVFVFLLFEGGAAFGTRYNMEGPGRNIDQDILEMCTISVMFDCIHIRYPWARGRYTYQQHIIIVSSCVLSFLKPICLQGHPCKTSALSIGNCIRTCRHCHLSMKCLVRKSCSGPFVVKWLG